MNWSSVFNVKLDILGLRGVSVADDVCKMVGINIRDINLTDSMIYEQFQNLRSPHGLFQIEAPTNFKVCQKVKPKNLEELSAVLALARPGALAYVDQYAAYTNEGEYQPIHPFFGFFQTDFFISVNHELSIQFYSRNLLIPFQ